MTPMGIMLACLVALIAGIAVGWFLCGLFEAAARDMNAAHEGGE